MWILPARGGLALRLTDPDGDRTLAVFHMATGLAVFAIDGDNDFIKNTAANRKRVERAIADMLASGRDWTLADPDEAHLAAARAAHARHFPIRRPWRAWRTLGGGVEHKWFATEQAAQQWVRGEWWAIERWACKPKDPSAPVDWDEVREGRLPERCALVRWRAWGETRECDGSCVRALQWLAVRPDPALVAEHAWTLRMGDPATRPFGALRSPSGDLPPALRATLDAGWLSIGPAADSRDCQVRPSLRGLLAAAREARRGRIYELALGDRTSDAAEAHERERRSWHEVKGDGFEWEPRSRLWSLLRLLRCLARDENSGEIRYEVSGRWRDGQVIDDHNSVAVVERRAAAGPSEWGVFRHRLAVPWSRTSARASVGEVSLSTARDWALRAADRMRGEVRS